MAITRRFRIVTVAVFVATLAAAVQATDSVPLKGKFAGAGAAFSGMFSHLGRFDGTVDLVTGAAVWTAADGDTVTAQTIAFIIEPDPISGTVFPYTQTIQITGGTGRFAGASSLVAFVPGPSTSRSLRTKTASSTARIPDPTPATEPQSSGGTRAGATYQLRTAPVRSGGP